MRIATWNINSVRLRLPLLLKLIGEYAPDVIALQETKTPDEFFPFEDLRAAGYPHIHAHGMKGYNGVAFLSKIPFTASNIHHRAGREDCRHIAVCLEPQPHLGSIELHNLYIPAGGDEPDPEINDKYAHKLGFVEEMAGWFKKHYKPDQKLIALGDFNIAPYEHDVWSHKQLVNVVSHTEPEITRLEKMRQSLSWIDVARHFIPMNEKCYTWWSYRNRDWKKSNRGRRLDHIWVTPPLKDALKGYTAIEKARDWPQPSDHVPVILDISL